MVNGRLFLTLVFHWRTSLHNCSYHSTPSGMSPAVRTGPKSAAARQEAKWHQLLRPNALPAVGFPLPFPFHFHFHFPFYFSEIEDKSIQKPWIATSIRGPSTAGIISIMIFRFVMPCLAAFPLIVAIPLYESNQLLGAYSDLNTLAVGSDPNNQGSLPSIGWDTSTSDPLDSITAMDPGSSAGVCVDGEGSQAGVQTTGKTRKRQHGSCSAFKKSPPAGKVAPPSPIDLPDVGDRVFTLPLAPSTETDGKDCKYPFENRFCCLGPLGVLVADWFYDVVHHCTYCKFPCTMLPFSPELKSCAGEAGGCLSLTNEFCCMDREVTILPWCTFIAIRRTESWLG